MGGSGVGWALINFFCLKHGRLFEVSANSRLGAYSNKYGMSSIQINVTGVIDFFFKTNPVM